MTDPLTRLEELAKASPTVIYQGDNESDKFYSAANPQVLLSLISALRIAKENLKHIAAKTPICEGCDNDSVSLLEHYDYLAERALAEIERLEKEIGG